MSANKEGHGAHGSRLQNWIEHELLHLAMHTPQDTVETELPDRNLSLRIPLVTHLMLYRIAQKLGRSKTACAEEVINNAVKDVYGQFGLPPIIAVDLEDYASQTEKAIPEKGAGARK